MTAGFEAHTKECKAVQGVPELRSATDIREQDCDCLGTISYYRNWDFVGEKAHLRCRHQRHMMRHEFIFSLGDDTILLIQGALKRRGKDLSFSATRAQEFATGFAKLVGELLEKEPQI